jgi:hypothetical protein
MRIPIVFAMFSLLSMHGAPALANSESAVKRPELANIKRVVLDPAVVTPAYPSPQADALEKLVVSVAKPLLTAQGLTVLEPSWNTHDPELVYWVEYSIPDDQCPNTLAVHLMLSVRDSVKLRNARMGRVDSTRTIWEWWAPGGEVRYVSPSDMESELDNWVREATHAFLTDAGYPNTDSLGGRSGQ